MPKFVQPKTGGFKIIPVVLDIYFMCWNYVTLAIYLLCQICHTSREEEEEEEEDPKRKRKIDWLELPNDILSLVAKKLNHRQKDLIRFGAVCVSWHSVYKDSCSRRLPLLMLATDLNNDQTRSFYNLSNRRVCNSQVPVPHNRHCPGSSHGWLLTVSPDFQVSLLNPFYHNNNEILLPPLQAFKHDESFREHFYVGFMHKAVLSTNPASEPNNYVVLAVYQARNHLAFFKPGDKTWTCIDSSQVCGVVDVIYYRDQFYSVNFQGDVFSIDFNHPEPEPRVSRIAPSPSLRGGDRRYLVESSGDLLQITRKTEFEERDGYPNFHFNDGFSAYKWDSGQRMWIELHNLDGRTFFVGDNSSLSVLASDFPECKPNSIYFTDDYFSAYFELEEYGIGPHDMGVFSFEDRTITSHYPTDSKMIYPAPIWIEPPL